jgi:thioredoxin-dependent peroxiredoxin
MTVDTQPKLLPVGSQAPDFNDVLATGNKKINLQDYRGQFLIMVFYPKDQTPGCTKQLCALRDDVKVFEGLNTHIVGVNPDGLESHERFVQAQSYPFPILVDAGSKIAMDYGASKPEGGIQRTVYIVGPQGQIIFAEQGMPTDETLAEAIRSFNA